MNRLLLLPLLALLIAAPTHGQNPNRAGLVVLFSDGSVQTQCVAFEEENISGLELLQRSAYDVIAQPVANNAAVCKIGPDGCDFPTEPCFCKSGGGQQGTYWSYWRLDGTDWRYSTLGAGVTRVHNGDVDGWAWGESDLQSDAPLPVLSFNQICPAQEPTVEPTSMPAPLPPTRPPAPTQSPMTEPFTTPTVPIAANLASEQANQDTYVVNYVFFGVLLLTSLGVIGAVLLRERR
jgi:hypothetical protein